MRNVYESEVENTNCLAGRQCPNCGNAMRFQVVASAVFMVMDDGTDVGDNVEWDETSPAYCTQCDWSGSWGELAVREAPKSDLDRPINEVLRWFDDLCEIADNNPADVEDWIANGAEHFDALKTARGNDGCRAENSE